MDMHIQFVATQPELSIVVFGHQTLVQDSGSSTLVQGSSNRPLCRALVSGQHLACACSEIQMCDRDQVKELDTLFTLLCCQSRYIIEFACCQLPPFF